MRDREQTARRPRIAGKNDELAIRRTGRGPLEIVLRLQGLIVFVDAEECHVEVIAGVGEVVGVAAKEGNLLFRRKYQPDVGVLLVSIEPVFAAAV